MHTTLQPHVLAANRKYDVVTYVNGGWGPGPNIDARAKYDRNGVTGIRRVFRHSGEIK